MKKLIVFVVLSFCLFLSIAGARAFQSAAPLLLNAAQPRTSETSPLVPARDWDAYPNFAPMDQFQAKVVYEVKKAEIIGYAPISLTFPFYMRLFPDGMYEVLRFPSDDALLRQKATRASALGFKLFSPENRNGPAFGVQETLDSFQIVQFVPKTAISR